MKFCLVLSLFVFGAGELVRIFEGFLVGASFYFVVATFLLIITHVKKICMYKCNGFILAIAALSFSLATLNVLQVLLKPDSVPAWLVSVLLCIPFSFLARLGKPDTSPQK